MIKIDKMEVIYISILGKKRRKYEPPAAVSRDAVGEGKSQKRRRSEMMKGKL